MEKNSAEETVVREKVWDVNLYVNITEQQIKKAIAEKHNMMVDENVLKLEIKRLREFLHEKADQIMT